VSSTNRRQAQRHEARWRRRLACAFAQSAVNDVGIDSVGQSDARHRGARLQGLGNDLVLEFRAVQAPLGNV